MRQTLKMIGTANGYIVDLDNPSTSPAIAPIGNHGISMGTINSVATSTTGSDPIGSWLQSGLSSGTTVRSAYLLADENTGGAPATLVEHFTYHFSPDITQQSSAGSQLTTTTHTISVFGESSLPYVTIDGTVYDHGTYSAPGFELTVSDYDVEATFTTSLGSLPPIQDPSTGALQGVAYNVQLDGWVNVYTISNPGVSGIATLTTSFDVSIS